MPFSGAKRVIHVSTAGSGVNDGSSWAKAVPSITSAVTKVPGGNALILVAPGVYTSTSLTIDIPNVRIQGAGVGVKLVSSSNAPYALEIASNNVEIADLTIDAVDSEFDRSAILSTTGSALENLRLTRCQLMGGKTIKAFDCKSIIIQECVIKGEENALLFGNQVDEETELYSCLAFNSEFRAINPVGADSQAVVVDGGELTATNCNFAVVAPISGSNRYVGVRVDHGGQVVLTGCKITIDRGAATTVHVGVDVVSATARMKLTACSIEAKGGTTPKSISPGVTGNASRMQADVSLLTPVWT